MALKSLDDFLIQGKATGKKIAFGILSNVGTLGSDFKGDPVEYRYISNLDFKAGRIYIVFDTMQSYSSAGYKDTSGGVFFTTNGTKNCVVYNNNSYYLQITVSGLGTNNVTVAFSRDSTSNYKGGACAGINYIVIEQ